MNKLTKAQKKSIEAGYKLSRLLNTKKGNDIRSIIHPESSDYKDWKTSKIDKEIFKLLNKKGFDRLQSENIILRLAGAIFQYTYEIKTQKEI